MIEQVGAKKTKRESNYARKHVWLSRRGLWGFEVAEPKPWRGAADGTSGEFRANRPCRYAGEVQEKILAIVKMQDEQAARRRVEVGTR